MEGQEATTIEQPPVTIKVLGRASTCILGVASKVPVKKPFSLAYAGLGAPQTWLFLHLNKRVSAADFNSLLEASDRNSLKANAALTGGSVDYVSAVKSDWKSVAENMDPRFAGVFIAGFSLYASSHATLASRFANYYHKILKRYGAQIERRFGLEEGIIETLRTDLPGAEADDPKIKKEFLHAFEQQYENGAQHDDKKLTKGEIFYIGEVFRFNLMKASGDAEKTEKLAEQFDKFKKASGYNKPRQRLFNHLSRQAALYNFGSRAFVYPIIFLTSPQSVFDMMMGASLMGAGQGNIIRELRGRLSHMPETTKARQLTDNWPRFETQEDDKGRRELFVVKGRPKKVQVMGSKDGSLNKLAVNKNSGVRRLWNNSVIGGIGGGISKAIGTLAQENVCNFLWGARNTFFLHNCLAFSAKTLAVSTAAVATGTASAGVGFVLPLTMMAGINAAHYFFSSVTMRRFWYNSIKEMREENLQRKLNGQEPVKVDYDAVQQRVETKLQESRPSVECLKKILFSPKSETHARKI